MRNLSLVLALAALAGCNTYAPYPNSTPFPGATVSANPAPRGSPEFCRRYASQTAANNYENRIDRSEDGFGARFISREAAARDGDRAYQRCLARR